MNGGIEFEMVAVVTHVYEAFIERQVLPTLSADVEETHDTLLRLFSVI